MSIPIRIIGARGQIADVIDGGLAVSPIPAPAEADDILTLPYVNFFTVGGDGSTEDLRVNGSLNAPIDAFIKAEANADIYISTISIVISGEAGGPGISLNQFGNINALTNGVVPYFEDKGNRLAFAERPLFSNFDFVRIGTLTPSVGGDQTAFRIQAARNSDAYAYVPVWDMTRLSPYGLGLRMKANTKQSIGLTIRDNITGVGGFEVLATGYRRFIK